MMYRTFLAAMSILALLGCATPNAPTPIAFTNPVLDADFPDPAVIRAPDGFYYAYATQTMIGGKWLNIQMARSRDLVRWEHLGDALPTKPAWAAKTQDFWAPHVQRDGGRYYLYYSAKPDAALTDDKQGLCLAIATAPSPAGPFVDMGHPLQCGDSFVNIDPMAFDDPATGKKLLYWGSGFQPIKVRELGADRISFAPGSRTIDLVPAVKSDDPDEYQKLVEGAWVMRHGGYYYLFFSGDNCCGPRAHYAVMVARSKSATGPFELAPDRLLLVATGKWVAPGHNSVISDGRGQDWLVYHAVDVGRPRTRSTDEINTRRVMLIDRLEWIDGWPRIAGKAPAN
jgi:arabinan endo-1,5-alpha-L-arabinosidase